MIYKILGPEEFDRIVPFCERNGIPIPNRGHGIVAVAEKDGEIVYCHMAHLQVHLDNQCKDVNYKGYVDFRLPYRKIEELIPRPGYIYTYPTFVNGIRMAEICGFHKAPFPTMIKELK